jgi:hypothetical protein
MSAVRCHRRARLVAPGEIATPDGRALLMLRHRPDVAGTFDPVPA